MLSLPWWMLVFPRVLDATVLEDVGLLPADPELRENVGVIHAENGVQDGKLLALLQAEHGFVGDAVEGKGGAWKSEDGGLPVKSFLETKASSSGAGTDQLTWDYWKEFGLSDKRYRVEVTGEIEGWNYDRDTQPKLTLSEGATAELDHANKYGDLWLKNVESRFGGVKKAKFFWGTHPTAEYNIGNKVKVVQVN